LGDGDSKAHKLIVDEAVYGARPVSKLECVRHVQKRLGSRLRSLKKRMGQSRLEDGKPIGGTGRLTKNKIDQLQVYYGNAIRNNTHDIQSMENAVMAIWHHTQSTDENPDHDLCPLENIHGVDIKGTWQGEHQIMSTHIPCLQLLLMQFIQSLKPSVTKIC